MPSAHPHVSRGGLIWILKLNSEDYLGGHDLRSIYGAILVP